MNATFPGSEDECRDLVMAIERNCVCVRDQTGAPTELCAPHKMLIEQKVLDDLLFARKIQACLKHEEGLEC